MIAYADVFPIIAHAISSYPTSVGDWEENAPYFLLTDLMYFACRKVGQGSTKEVKEYMDLLDKLFFEGDADVQFMIEDQLEGIRSECPCRHEMLEQFSSRLRNVWSLMERPTALPE